MSMWLFVLIVLVGGIGCVADEDQRRTDRHRAPSNPTAR